MPTFTAERGKKEKKKKSLQIRMLVMYLLDRIHGGKLKTEVKQTLICL